MTTIESLLPSLRPLAQALGLAESTLRQTGFRDTGFVIFEDRSVRLRLSSEQGEASIDLANQSEHELWFDLALFLNLASAQPLDSQHEIEALVAYGIANAGELRQAFGDNFASTRVRLEAGEKARYALLFPDHPIG